MVVVTTLRKSKPAEAVSSFLNPFAVRGKRTAAAIAAALDREAVDRADPGGVAGGDEGGDAFILGMGCASGPARASGWSNGCCTAAFGGEMRNSSAHSESETTVGALALAGCTSSLCKLGRHCSHKLLLRGSGTKNDRPPPSLPCHPLELLPCQLLELLPCQLLELLWWLPRCCSWRR